MSQKKARPTTLKKLIRALMERLSEYEAYFTSLAQKQKKPDNQAVAAYRNLIEVISKIEYDNDMGGAAKAARPERGDGPEASVAGVLGDVYGVRLESQGAERADTAAGNE